MDAASVERRSDTTDERSVTADDREPSIAVDGLIKEYGSGEDAVRAVDDVSFSVQPGTVVGILGPNGAGKTTTIKSLLGLVIPDEGEISIGGVSVQDDPAGAYRQVDATLEGARNVYWRLTPRENLQFFSGLKGLDPRTKADRHDELLERFGISEKADTAVNDLSRGQKQKVSLATTLAGGATVTFLDEPTLGLDVESSLELRRELSRMVEEESMTVLLSSHDMDVIEEICDRVIVMNDGQVIADDSVENLLELFRTQAVRIVFDEPPSDDLVETVREQFDATAEPSGPEPAIEVTADDDELVYELMATLRRHDPGLERIDSVEPDLEEIFLRLTEDATEEVTADGDD